MPPQPQLEQEPKSNFKDCGVAAAGGELADGDGGEQDTDASYPGAMGPVLAAEDGSRAEERYTNAINMIRNMPSVSGPGEKLNVLHTTFKLMSTAVSSFWNSAGAGADGPRLSTMDEVLPVLLMVLVRAQIKELGAEIQFMLDFLDTDELSGESRILLTTLQASYYQLQLEVSSRADEVDPLSSPQPH